MEVFAYPHKMKIVVLFEVTNKELKQDLSVCSTEAIYVALKDLTGNRDQKLEVEIVQKPDAQVP